MAVCGFDWLPAAKRTLASSERFNGKHKTRIWSAIDCRRLQPVKAGIVDGVAGRRRLHALTMVALSHHQKTEPGWNIWPIPEPFRIVSQVVASFVYTECVLSSVEWCRHRPIIEAAARRLESKGVCVYGVIVAIYAHIYDVLIAIFQDFLLNGRALECFCCVWLSVYVFAHLPVRFPFLRSFTTQFGRPAISRVLLSYFVHFPSISYHMHMFRRTDH